MHRSRVRRRIPPGPDPARPSHAPSLMKRGVILGQVLLALGIYSVWLVRYDKATPFRGRGATSLSDEFAARPAAAAMSALMAGATWMHLRVNDPIVRAVPALAMLAVSGYVALEAGRSGEPRRAPATR